MAEMKQSTNYAPPHPVIGIRPTVDGRRGPMKLRESPEDQTMAAASHRTLPPAPRCPSP